MKETGSKGGMVEGGREGGREGEREREREREREVHYIGLHLQGKLPTICFFGMLFLVLCWLYLCSWHLFICSGHERPDLFGRCHKMHARTNWATICSFCRKSRLSRNNKQRRLLLSPTQPKYCLTMEGIA